MRMNMNERLTDRYGRAAEAIGYDESGNAYVMRWNVRQGCWAGCGFDPVNHDIGFCFLLHGAMAGFIVEHSQPMQARR